MINKKHMLSLPFAVLILQTASTHGATPYPTVAPDAKPKIVGGTPAAPGQFPWQAQLLRNGGFICGASILNNQWILTAAHCTSGGTAEQFKVRVGSLNADGQGAQTFSAEKLIVKEDYNSGTIDNDLALLKLSEPIQYSKNIQPVDITKVDPDSYQNSTALQVSGWGSISEGGNISPDLLYAEVNYVHRNICNSDYQKDNGKITDGMICASAPGKDACQGDSGGPLVHYGSNGRNSYEVGVVSWGAGCARPGYPGVYTNIYKYRDWIKSHIKT